MAGLNRAAIVTALMTLTSTMSVNDIQADAHKDKKPGPPGFEKHHFVLPGHTKKWSKGMIVPATMAIIPFHEWQTINLAPPPRGTFYGYVDRNLLLICNTTHEVLDAVIAADAAINGVER